MMLLKKTLEIAVSHKSEVDEAVDEILREHPGAKISSYKVFQIETNEASYVKVEIRLIYVEEKLLKKGEIMV